MLYSPVTLLSLAGVDYSIHMVPVHYTLHDMTNTDDLGRLYKWEVTRVGADWLQEVLTSLSFPLPTLAYQLVWLLTFVTVLCDISCYEK